MSGIGGIMLQEGTPSDPLLYSLAKSLEHRGPDAIIGEIYDQVGFVHSRLSVIDHTNGNQPLHAENLALIASGTIYNYVELREAFPSYPFKTQSDLESILLLYKEYGTQFVDHIRGMYAFALYDNLTQTLFLSRDAFGIKPLYYWEGINGIAFASEPQALLKAHLLSPHLNKKKVYSLLSLNYTWGRETLYEGIQRVMPGETIVVQKGRIKQRFLRQALPKGPPSKLLIEESLSSLDKTLDRSVEVHLRGEVPIGLFLSGDINSSCLLKLMSRHTSESIKTFSIALPGKADERESVLHLTKLLNTDHQEVTFDEQDFWTLSPRVITALDDPTFDILTLPLYKMAQEAAKSVKVLLSPEGGNEVFGGYEHYKQAIRPWWLGGSLLNNEDYLKGMGLMRTLPPLLWKERDDFVPVLESQDFTNLQISQALDFEAFVPNDLLLKLDRCLTAHGIEARTPFLDMMVTDSFFNLPDEFKIKKGTTQWILREWLKLHFPETASFFKKKGPPLPISNWIFSKGKEIGYLVAHQAGIEQLFYPDRVQKLFLSSNKNAQRFTWPLLAFALWHQIHILKIPPQGRRICNVGKAIYIRYEKILKERGLLFSSKTNIFCFIK